MQEQTAVLVQHQIEWILGNDDDESERVWKHFDAGRFTVGAANNKCCLAKPSWCIESLFS